MNCNVRLQADTLCRACLSEGSNMIPLLNKMEDNRTLFEVLSFIINMNISKNKYPQQVCKECYVLICKMNEFKKICMKSDNILNVVIKDGTFSDTDTSGKVKLEIASKPRLLYQCAVCLQKFLTCELLESHVVCHTVMTKTSKDFDNYKNISQSNTVKNTAATNANNTYNMKQENGLRTNNTDNEIGRDDIMDARCTQSLEYKQEKSFKCSTCCGYFNEKDYKIHIEYCKRSATNIPLQMNLINVDSNVKNKDLSFSSSNSLKSHQRILKDKNEIFQCRICVRSFLRKISFVLHMKTHKLNDNVKFVCKTCRQEFQAQSHLDEHILALHTSRLHCKLCNLSFTTKEYLKAHKATHKVRKNQCMVCNKSFKKMWFLNQHMRTHTGERPFLCSHCGQRFSQKYNLELHMRIHEGFQKTFICDTCDKRLGTKVALIRHIGLKHSGAIQSFVCEHCGKRFMSSSKLVKHCRLHRTERPHGCDLCSMRFLTKWTLKRHKRVHSGDQPHQCSLCNKTFIRRYDVENHKPCHASKQLYACIMCGRGYSNPDSLDSHIKSHKDLNSLTLKSRDAIHHTS